MPGTPGEEKRGVPGKELGLVFAFWIDDYIDDYADEDNDKTSDEPAREKLAVKKAENDGGEHNGKTQKSKKCTHEEAPLLVVSMNFFKFKRGCLRIGEV